MKYSNDGIYYNVILKSAAGYYLGAASFSEGFFAPYCRDSGYYPSEKALLKDFPDAIPFEKVLEYAKQDGYIK